MADAAVPARPRVALDVTCPTCEGAPGARCRTLRTGRTTDTHMARYDALVAARTRPTPIPKESPRG